MKLHVLNFINSILVRNYFCEFNGYDFQCHLFFLINIYNFIFVFVIHILQDKDNNETLLSKTQTTCFTNYLFSDIKYLTFLSLHLIFAYYIAKRLSILFNCHLSTVIFIMVLKQSFFF